METIFKYEALTLAQSTDLPGSLVIGIQDREEKEVFRHILPPEGRFLLGELLGADIFGQYTYGALRIIKHAGGWLEITLASWTDPEPVAVIPEHLSEEVAKAVRENGPH
jgi:hypothetical protein